MFGILGVVNPHDAHRSFALHAESLNEIWFFVPIGGSGFPNRFYRLALDSGGWFARDLAVDIIGFGAYFLQNNLTWDDAVGTWEDWNIAWDSNKIKAGTITILLAGRDPNQVFEYQFAASDDDGVAINYVVETKDFFSPNRKLRFDRFDYSGSGTNVQMSVSFDRGTSYHDFPVANHGSVVSKRHEFRQQVSDTVRLKWSGVGAFSIEWFGIRAKSESQF